MKDDKPKHKPSKKRTLEEVLKSLQDLIRNDIVPGTEPAKPVKTETPAPPKATTPAPTPPPPPTPAAPLAPMPIAAKPVAHAQTPTGDDEFNAALDALDELITNEIIEPVERARSAPPEPMTDALLDLEEFLKESGQADDGQADDEAEDAELEATDELTEPEAPIVLEDTALTTPIESETPDAAFASLETGPVEDETIELIALDDSLESPSTTDTPDVNAGNAASESNAPNDMELDTIEWDDPGLTEPTTIEFEPPAEETVDLEIATPPPPEEPKPKRAKKPPTDSEVDFPVLTEVQEQFPFDEPPPEQTVESKTISEEFELVPTEPGPAAMAANNDPRSGDRFPTAPPRVPAATPSAATLNSETEGTPAPRSTTADPMRSENKPQGRPPEAADKDRPAFDPAPAEDDIPVLQEIADAGIDLNEPLPLPGSNQARDIAIRVIAKLNIERRKAGESPLDIKSIERLQRILSDTLSRHEAAKKPEDPHH